MKTRTSAKASHPALAADDGGQGLGAAQGPAGGRQLPQPLGPAPVASVGRRIASGRRWQGGGPGVSSLLPRHETCAERSRGRRFMPNSKQARGPASGPSLEIPASADPDQPSWCSHKTRDNQARRSQDMLGGFQADIDSLPPVSFLPPMPLPAGPGPADGVGSPRPPTLDELLAPFALRDWCARGTAGAPFPPLAAEDWIPAGQLGRVAAKGGEERQVGLPRAAISCEQTLEVGSAAPFARAAASQPSLQCSSPMRGW